LHLYCFFANPSKLLRPLSMEDVSTINVGAVVNSRQGWCPTAGAHECTACLGSTALTSLKGAILSALLLSQFAWCQTPPVLPGTVPAAQYSGSSDQSSSPSSPSNSGTAAQSPAANGQSPFLASVPEGKATAEVLPLSFKDAIDRALRNNLGLLLGRNEK